MLFPIYPWSYANTRLTEYAGRHPCVVNHLGRALHFAGEDKAALTGTAPKKSTKNKVRKVPTSESSADEDKPSLAAPKKTTRRKARPPPASESSNSAESSAGEVTVWARNVTEELSSPSGHVRKRARVATARHASVSPVAAVPSRPVKSLPVRATGAEQKDNADTRKRKRGVVPVDQQVVDYWAQPEATHEDSIAPGIFAQQDRGVTPLYQPPFGPAPFSMQPPYAPHPPFPGPAYQPPFYPPTYGQQAWPSSNPTNAHPQWPAQQGYNQEEMEAFLAMRRAGGFGNGPQY